MHKGEKSKVKENSV